MSIKKVRAVIMITNKKYEKVYCRSLAYCQYIAFYRPEPDMQQQ